LAWEEIAVKAAQNEQEPITRVVFRRFKNEPRDVIAFFPELREGNKYVSSYMHIGQHAPAMYPHRLTEPANLTEPDVAALERELTSIGYRLEVMQS
jgi:hypothetical protein